MHPSPVDHLSDDGAAGSRPGASGEHDVAIGLADAFADLASDHPGYDGDDEETLEAPAPPIPSGTPSPLGDDDAPLEHDAGGTPDRESGVVRVADAAPSPAVERRTPIQGLAFPDSLRARSGVSREAVEAAREARVAARRAQAATRLVVLAIWSTAVLLATLLAFFALAAR